MRTKLQLSYSDFQLNTQKDQDCVRVKGHKTIVVLYSFNSLLFGECSKGFHIQKAFGGNRIQSKKRK